MKYILDFDGVLYNTALLKEKMKACGIDESDRGTDVFERILKQDPAFTFESLVFPNALKFIQEHGNDCIVVSSATSETQGNNTDLEAQIKFQEEKILRSGVKALVSQVRVVGEFKSGALTELRQEFQDEDLVYVDDREHYVQEAEDCGIPGVFMDRERKGVGQSPEGLPIRSKFNTIHSFEGFNAHTELWKEQQ